jgi:hypothetical protein
VKKNLATLPGTDVMIFEIASPKKGEIGDFDSHWVQLFRQKKANTYWFTEYRSKSDHDIAPGPNVTKLHLRFQ